MKNFIIKEGERSGVSSSSSENNMNSDHDQENSHSSELRILDLFYKNNISKGKELVKNPSRTGERKARRTSSGWPLVPPPEDGGNRPLSLLERQMFPGIMAGNVAPVQPGEKTMGTQLTIFYQGNVNVYDVSLDKAKAIMHLAGESSLQLSTPAAKTDALETIKISNTPEISKLRENFPMTTTRSLRMFFDKRRDRIMKSSPYASSSRKQDEDE